MTNPPASDSEHSGKQQTTLTNPLAINIEHSRKQQTTVTTVGKSSKSESSHTIRRFTPNGVHLYNSCVEPVRSPRNRESFDSLSRG